MTRGKHAAGSDLPHLSRPVGRRQALAGVSIVALGIGSTASSPPRSRAPGERALVTDESLLGSHGLAPVASAPVLGALANGEQIAAGDGHRYALGAVFEMRHGGIPFVLIREDGERLALEILRVDPARPAPGRNGWLAVHVPNRGNGSTSTEESAGLAAMAVAAVLIPAHAPLALSTLAERCARSPLGTFDVPA